MSCSCSAAAAVGPVGAGFGAEHGDVGETLRALAPLVEPKGSRRFLDDMLQRHERALTRVVEAYTGERGQRSPIHPEYVADVLDELAADDAVFTVDTGMNNVWAARYLTPNGRRRTRSGRRT